MTATIMDVECSTRAELIDSGPETSKQETSKTAMVKPGILVIDDDACFCELLSLYFMAKGFDVIAARTASQAELLVQDGRFDLMILDWHLNGVDALDLLNRCKTRYPKIPVIIFTGDDADMSLTAALAGKADGLVRKMGSLESLSSQVCNHLGWPELRVVK